MDRLTLTLFGLDREQEAAIKEIFEARGWDYVHEISLPFLNFVEIFPARNSFVMPFFATDDTTVVNIEPETERKGDSCASARNVTAGVDVSHSGQGNDGNASVVLVPHSRIRKKLYRKCRSMMNMRGAWRRPLYVRKKETAMCRDHIDGTVVHVLRSCRSVS